MVMTSSFLGRTIAGRYVLDSEIGRGGMGVVYKARQPSLARTVAVKVLPPQLAMDPEFVERFRQEAQTIAGLAHENIVHVYDIVEEENACFIVMEFVEGQNLRSLVKSRRVSLEETRSIGVSVARALHFAHQRGIVHRDVKSHNVMITGEGRVKLMDFGIARVAGSGIKTQTGAVLGTPEYMAPEQAQSGSVTAQTDIYSLGVMLFELATGKLPFTGNDPFSVALKHLTEEPPRPRSLDASVPEYLEGIILRAMAKDPAARYASAADLEKDLLEGGAALEAGATRLEAVVPVVNVGPMGPQGYTPVPSAWDPARGSTPPPTWSTAPPAVGTPPPPTFAPGTAPYPQPAHGGWQPPPGGGTPPPPTFAPGAAPGGWGAPPPGGTPPGTWAGQAAWGGQPPHPDPAYRSGGSRTGLWVLLAAVALFGLIGVGVLAWVVWGRVAAPAKVAEIMSNGASTDPATAVGPSVPPPTEEPVTPPLGLDEILREDPQEQPVEAEPEPEPVVEPVVTPVVTQKPKPVPVAPPPVAPEPTRVEPEPEPEPEPARPVRKFRPPISGSFACTEAIEFHVDPDDAMVSIFHGEDDLEPIGIADDWDGRGGGQKWRPAKGTYIVQFDLKGYRSQWAEIEFGSGGKKICDVDNELREEN
jgi:predicted Ser/Thr protein kinase